MRPLPGWRDLGGIEGASGALGRVGELVASPDDRTAQAAQPIVGALLATPSLVLILLGSVHRYETGCLRLFIERDTVTGLRYAPIPGLVRGIAVFLFVVSFFLIDRWS